MDRQKAYDILLAATAELRADRKTHALMIEALNVLKSIPEAEAKSKNKAKA